MNVSERPAVTDSPWFWVLIFSLMALGALAAIGGKYGRRQAVIERQYQARERSAKLQAPPKHASQPTRDEDRGERRGFASPGETLIPLWPLAVILTCAALFAAVMLYRGRGLQRAQPSGRPGSLPEERSPP